MIPACLPSLTLVPVDRRRILSPTTSTNRKTRQNTNIDTCAVPRRIRHLPRPLPKEPTPKTIHKHNHTPPPRRHSPPHPSPARRLHPLLRPSQRRQETLGRMPLHIQRVRQEEVAARRNIEEYEVRGGGFDGAVGGVEGGGSTGGVVRV